MKKEEALEILVKLKEAGLPFLVIGSMGLALRMPRQSGPEPADCDLLLPGSETALNGFTEQMTQFGYRVRSWGDPVRAPLEMAALRGRFYLRANRAELIFDATYECEHLPFDRAWNRREWLSGIPCACLEDIAVLMRVRNSAKDRAHLGRVRCLVKNPPSQSPDLPCSSPGPDGKSMTQAPVETLR